MFELTNRRVVVTGGASGIGKAIAMLFARQGAEVHLLEVDEATAENTVEAIVSSGGASYMHHCDVSNAEQVSSTMKAISADGRAVDILVNNAGISHIGTAENTSAEDFERIVSVNVKGVYHCTQSVLPIMKKNGGGVILNVCSIAAITGLPDRFAYSMSKGAVYSMTLSVARDFVKDKIRCNAIAPARVHTPFLDGFLQKHYKGQEEEMFRKLSGLHPVGRMGEPGEVATLALYLCSDEATFITGCMYPLDGGFVNIR